MTQNRVSTFSLHHLPITMAYKLPPELLILVAKYFTPTEATAPSLACQTWHQIFAPSVWRRLDISACNYFARLQPLEQLIKNAHFVKDLKYRDCDLPSECLAVQYTHLTTLHLFSGPRLSPHLGDNFARLVILNDQLEEVTISGLRSENAWMIWESIVSRPRLRDLTVCGCSMMVDEFTTLWRGLTNLERLTLDGIQRREGGEGPIWDGLVMLPALQSIQLGQASMVPLLKFCPNMRRLERLGDSENGDNFMDELHTILKAGHLGWLDSLCITQIHRGEKLGLCVEAMDRLKILDVGLDVSAKRLWSDLARHFETLEQVSFEENDKVSSMMVQAILASCPRLTCLKAFQLRPSDVIKGKPWVCSGFRSLRIEIIIKSADNSVIHIQSCAIFEHLSKLEKLEHLNLRGVTGDPLHTQGLDLRLESELDQLSAVRNIRYLNFENTIQNMAAEDIVWMRKHWTRLEQVIGRCNAHGNFESQPPQPIG